MEKVQDAVIMAYTYMPVHHRNPEKAHWAYVLGQNIAAMYPTQPVVPVIRLKKIVHNGQEALIFKQNINRVRLTLVANENTKTVNVLVYDLPIPNPSLPYKPSYCHTPTLEKTFNYTTEADKLARFCVEHLSKVTPHVAGEYPRIPITSDFKRLSPTMFYSGRIVDATYTEDHKWTVSCEDGVTLKVDAKTLGGNRPAARYYIVYKSEVFAEVIPATDHERYYAYGQ
jgi:hypothetical protein